MIVPLNWLREYIDITESPAELAQIFTSIGYMLDRPIAYMEDDAILDLEVRQNRSDCLSLLGLAQELSAVLQRPLKMPQLDTSTDVSSGSTRVTIPHPELCPRFFAYTFEHVQVKESPEWMKKRLESYGVKSINNVVDITNYVAIELGMPLHAYDADKVVDRHITIRNAYEGESLVLFGGKLVQCSTDDIIHADAEGPIGLGALMGGEEKSVHATTTSIILEAAVYDQASVRRSSRRHAIRTEASTRLEKFLHPHLVEMALQRAAVLITELTGGRCVARTDAYPRPAEEKTITCSFDTIRRLGGIDIPDAECERILNALHCTTTPHGDGTFSVSVPFFRTDIEQEADIVEEVIRIYGYDSIPEKLPHNAPPLSIQSKWFDLEEKARDAAIAMGYDEVITEPLTHEDVSILEPIHLENSLTSEKNMLRTTLQHSLHHALVERAKYRQTDIRLCEVGKIYFNQDGRYMEKRVIGLATSGAHTFAQLKGDCEALCQKLGYTYESRFVQFVALDEHSFCASLDLEALINEGQVRTPSLLTTPPQLIVHDFVCTRGITESIEDILHHIQTMNPLIYKVQHISVQERDAQTVEHLIRVSYSQTQNTLSEADVRDVRNDIQTYLHNL